MIGEAVNETQRGGEFEPEPERRRVPSSLYGAQKIGIYNPLHSVLQHFVTRLIGVLEAAGMPAVMLHTHNGEVGRDPWAKAAAFGAHIRDARHYVETDSPTIVAWPLFGWYEIPLWRHKSHKSFVIMHDPEPLVPQNGLSPRSAMFSARASGEKWPRVVTMSHAAYAIAARYFNPRRLSLVPHPMKAPHASSAPTPSSRTVLVLGQYKPARDLDIMAKTAQCLRSADWEPVVVGRGWPEIPGWTVINQFLNESDFCAVLSSAAALLLPYRHYFQSGVALRALEAGIPVVGRDSSFLTSVLGRHFPGSVDDWGLPSAWLTAVEEAVASRDAQLRAASLYATKGVAGWRNLLTGGMDSDG